MECCAFCGSSERDEVNLGQFCTLGTTTKLSVHYYCTLLSAQISQSGKDQEGVNGFLLKDIKKELERCKFIRCCYCKRPHANLKCTGNRNCYRNFHLPCGLKNKTLHKFSKIYPSYCHIHRKRNVLPASFKNVEQAECTICYEILTFPTDLSKLYFPKCCSQKNVFHIKCVKVLALNAGYFTKCPVCNNKAKFVKDICDNGVFVPLQDASWERVPGAFSELTDRYSKCDAETCQCPRGKQFGAQNKKSKWYLILCALCGSSGVHLKCNNQSLEYTCSTCLMEEDQDNEEDFVLEMEEGEEETNVEETNVEETNVEETNVDIAHEEEVIDLVSDDDDVVCVGILRVPKTVTFSELVESVGIPNRFDDDGFVFLGEKYVLFLNDEYDNYNERKRVGYGKKLQTKYPRR